MAEKRAVINQKTCDMVRLMMAGKPKMKTVADMLGIGKTSVQRIVAAEYDYTKYLMNTDRRRIEEKNAKADAAIQRLNEAIEKERAAQKAESVLIPGQIRMEIPERVVEAEKPEMSDQVKMMRFIAGQVDRIVKAIEGMKA